MEDVASESGSQIEEGFGGCYIWSKCRAWGGGVFIDENHEDVIQSNMSGTSEVYACI